MRPNPFIASEDEAVDRTVDDLVSVLAHPGVDVDLDRDPVWEAAPGKNRSNIRETALRFERLCQQWDQQWGGWPPEQGWPVDVPVVPRQAIASTLLVSGTSPAPIDVSFEGVIDERLGRGAEYGTFEQAKAAPRFGGQIHCFGQVQLFGTPSALRRLMSGDAYARDVLAVVMTHELAHHADPWLAIERPSRPERYYPVGATHRFTHSDLPHAHRPAEVHAFEASLAYLYRRWERLGIIDPREPASSVVEKLLAFEPSALDEFEHMAPRGQRAVWWDLGRLIARHREPRER